MCHAFTMIPHLLQGLVVTTGSFRPLPASFGSRFRREGSENPYHLLIQALRTQPPAGERIAAAFAA